MQVMGMRFTVVWSVWLLWCCVTMIVLSALLALILWLGDVLRHSDPSLVFVTIAVYSVALVMFW